MRDGTLVRAGAVPDEAPIRSRLIELKSGELAVASADGALIKVYVSGDRAATWRLVGSVSAGTIDAIAGIALASTDGTYVVLADEQSSSAFRFALLATSVDGGVTWKTERAPIGGELSTVDSTFWLTGGAASNQAFSSVDGSDWRERSLPLPANDWSADRAFGSAQIGAVIPVTIHDGDRDSRVVFMSTRDAGQSWTEGASAVAPASASGSTIPSVVGPDGSWMLVYVDGSNLVSGRLGTDDVKIVSPNGLPQGVMDVEMIGPTVTVVATPSSCPAGKDSCVSQVVILQSADNGQTWRVLE